MQSLAETIADGLKAAKVRYLFGVPGGGSSLDLIDASARRGIQFHLSQTETAGAIMASVTGELTGSPGVVLTGVGPGAASVVNGAAYASLEQAPLILFTDQVEGVSVGGIHQRYDQTAIFDPLVKNGVSLSATNGAAKVAELIELSQQRPFGPVHIDLSSAQAALPSDPFPGLSTTNGGVTESNVSGELESLLQSAKRPVLLIGLEARCKPIADALDRFLADCPCPVLTTYKAKGVVPDDHECLVGHVTGGTAEADVLHKSDLIIALGLDPVELINQPWPYRAPVVEVSTYPHPEGSFSPVHRLHGDEGVCLTSMTGSLNGSTWAREEIASVKFRMRSRFLGPTDQPLAEHDPRLLVPELQRAAGPNVRLTVDSGAHMFPAMALWNARNPFDVLKSNGLSTMGFALPAAIGAWLCEPERPVIALTGDGGLSMCLTELATAARLGAQVVTVVLNDAALSLIDIKQQAQQRPSLGVRYPTVNYAAAADALGVPGRKVDDPDALASAVMDALERDGPSLIDVAVDPSGYGDMLAALRK